MSKKNLATLTLIAAGLSIASVPALASNVEGPASNLRAAASERCQPADHPIRERLNTAYSEQIAAPSMKDGRTEPQPATAPDFGPDHRDHLNN